MCFCNDWWCYFGEELFCYNYWFCIFLNHQVYVCRPNLHMPEIVVGHVRVGLLLDGDR